jgi:hypothetical protein
MLRSVADSNLAGVQLAVGLVVTSQIQSAIVRPRQISQDAATATQDRRDAAPAQRLLAGVLYTHDKVMAATAEREEAKRKQASEAEAAKVAREEKKKAAADAKASAAAAKQAKAEAHEKKQQEKKAAAAAKEGAKRTRGEPEARPDFAVLDAPRTGHYNAADLRAPYTSRSIRRAVTSAPNGGAGGE